MRPVLLPLLCCCLWSVALAAAGNIMEEAVPGMTRKAFDRWHLGSLGVEATDREWKKADKDEDGYITDKVRTGYEACCCKFNPSAWARSASATDGVLRRQAARRV